MPVAEILQLLTTAEGLLSTFVPQLIGLAQAAKAGASETDVAKIDAALKGLQPANDSLHAQVQAL